VKVCIPIEKAQPGMRLAEDISNVTGMILCRQGTILTETLIERLKNANVEKLIIEEFISEEEARKQFEEKKILINKAFANKSSPSMQMLKEVFLKFWEEKYLINVSK